MSRKAVLYAGIAATTLVAGYLALASENAFGATPPPTPPAEKGTFLCSDMLSAPSFDVLFPLTWAAGYLDAMGKDKGVDYLAGLDFDRYGAWIATYCVQHPTDNMALAVEAFVKSGQVPAAQQ
jgi:hypothetical protein